MTTPILPPAATTCFACDRPLDAYATVDFCPTQGVCTCDTPYAFHIYTCADCGTIYGLIFDGEDWGAE